MYVCMLGLFNLLYLHRVTVAKDLKKLSSDYCVRSVCERETEEEEAWRKAGFKLRMEDTGEQVDSRTRIKA